MVLQERLTTWRHGREIRDTPFCGVAHVVHFARMACTQGNTAGTKVIRDALMERWIQYQRIPQQQSQNSSNSFMGMFQSSEVDKSDIRRRPEISFTASKSVRIITKKFGRRFQSRRPTTCRMASGRGLQKTGHFATTMTALGDIRF